VAATRGREGSDGFAVLAKRAGGMGVLGRCGVFGVDLGGESGLDVEIWGWEGREGAILGRGG